MTQTVVFSGTPRALISAFLTFYSGLWCHWAVTSPCCRDMVVVYGVVGYPVVWVPGGGSNSGTPPWYGSGAVLTLFPHCIPTVAVLVPHCGRTGPHCGYTVLYWAVLVPTVAVLGCTGPHCGCTGPGGEYWSRWCLLGPVGGY